MDSARPRRETLWSCNVRDIKFILNTGVGKERLAGSRLQMNMDKKSSPSKQFFFFFKPYLPILKSFYPSSSFKLNYYEVKPHSMRTSCLGWDSFNEDSISYLGCDLIFYGEGRKEEKRKNRNFKIFRGPDISASHCGSKGIR